MSRGLGRYTEAFVTSLVVGKDMVPRMSMPNLARMIDQMVRTDHPCPKDMTVDALFLLADASYPFGDLVAYRVYVSYLRSRLLNASFALRPFLLMPRFC